MEAANSHDPPPGHSQSRHGDAEDDETRPLLPASPQPADGAPQATHGLSLDYRSIYLLFVVVAALDFTMYMVNLPLTRVYESIACYHYYSATDPSRFADPGSIPESLCKAEPVQQELALVRGYEFLCMSLPGVVIGFPFGVAADRYGRKPVFLICVLGLVLAVGSVLLVCWFWWVFPLRLVWGAWLLTVVGGGPTVLMSTAFSMLSDLTNADDRTRIFLQLAVAILSAQAGATTLASFMMRRFGPFFPIAVGYGVGLTASVLALFLKETLQRQKRLSDDVLDDLAPTPAKPATWKARLSAQTSSVVNSVQFLFENPIVVTLVTTFFINTIGTSSINLAIQYASKRFSISISDAGMLISIRAVVTIIYFLALLPLMGELLQARFGLKGSIRDLWLARLTVLCLPLGFVLMSLSPFLGLMAVGMVLTALGSGCGSLVRSIANSMVDTTQVARLNGAISIVDTLGILISGPLLAEIYALGLRMGGGWLALPFFMAAVLTAIASGIVWVVRVPERTA